MVDRDVKLIVRAKNEASKTLDAVSDALRDLKDAQEDVGRSAGSTDSLISQLGAEFSKLNKEVAGLDALGKVSGHLDRATSHVDRLSKETRESAEAFARQARAAQEASKAAASYRNQVESARSALEGQKQAVAAARAEQTKANKELRQAESALARIQKQIEKGRTGRAAQSASVFAAEDVAKARASATAAAAAFNQQKEAQDAARTSLKSLSDQAKVAAQNEARLKTEAEGLATATNRKRAALAQSRNELSQIQTLAGGASAALGGMAINQKAVADASRQSADTLRSVKTELDAMRRFSDGGGGFTDPQTAAAIRKQREEVERARQAYQTLDAMAQRVAVSTRGMEGPTRAHAQAVRDSAAAARAAKAEYEKQLAVLNRMPGAMRRMNGLRGLFQSFYGESRKSMSVFQRLRGEVLSLTTAYVGLYGAIRNVGGVINAYQQLEAAQNRLGAIFNQDQAQIRKELGFLERQAARLGIEFGVLADEYGKFAVAANAANFTSEETRKVFLSVAEAGRVNKLSLEQMSGIFLALQQMISKGKVMSEELRRQLGDRLPGAFNIMADAIGVTTAELDNMMQAGEVIADSDTLMKFADQLDRRFGSQLPSALRSTTTLIGQFVNELFQAQLRVAEGGFIDSLNIALENMNEWFRSREGRDFFLSLGAALGRLVEVLAQVPRYFDEIAIVIKAIIALKTAQWVTGLATAFKLNLLPAILTTTTAFRNSLMGVRAYAQGLTTLGGVARSVALALRSIPGVAVFAAATYVIQDILLGWVGGVDDATSAVVEHKRIMGEVLTAYEAVRGSTRSWVDELKNVSRIDLERDFISMRDRLEKVRSETRSGLSRILNEVARAYQAVGNITEEEALKFRDLIEDADLDKPRELRDAIRELNNELSNEEAKKFAYQLDDLVESLVEAREDFDQVAVAANEAGVEFVGVKEAADQAGQSVASLADATQSTVDPMASATEAADNYRAALRALQEAIPELAEEFKKLEALAEIEANFQRGVENLGNMRGGRARFRALVDARDAAIQAELTKGLGAGIQEAIKLLVQKEDFRSSPYWDVNAWRIGFGSDTVTLDDGSIKRVTQGMKITQRDAYRDLERRIGEFNEGIIRKIGQGAFNAFTPQQQAVLTSLAYNYGSLPDRVANVIRNDGSVGEIAEAIRGLRNDRPFNRNGRAVNYDRRMAEAQMFASSETGQQAFEVEQRRTEELRRQTEELAKQDEAVANIIASKEFELRQNQLIAEGKGREAAIEAAIAEAQRQKSDLTAEQLELITDIAGRLWDQQNAGNAIKEAEEQVNRLYQHRQELMRQIEYHQNQGEVSQAEALKEQLSNINKELREAIQNTIALYQQMGGPDADLAIAKLNTMALSIQDIGDKAIITGQMIAEKLTGALTSAFKAMAKAIAEGEDAWEAFSRAFLEGIANMLIEIGELIIKQMILNALQGLLGGFSFGGVGVGLFHSGGIAGRSGSRRTAHPGWFNNAVRYHSGGIAGLAPGELPAILKEGEEILTRDDPRHILNGGGGQPPVVKVVNTFDSADVISEGLSSPVGEQAFLNVVKSNAGKVRQILGQ